MKSLTDAKDVCWSTATSQDLNKLPALREDVEGLRSDIAASRHLEGMLKRNGVSTRNNRLFASSLSQRRIQDSNDIEIILKDEIVPEGSEYSSAKCR